MALDSWLSHAVPDHYAVRNSQTLREKLVDTIKNMEKAQSPDKAHAAIAPTREAADALARAAAAIKASDRAGVARSRDRLSAAAGDLRRVQDSKPSS